MSKTDLRARPMFHHTKDAIEAHLTIVFTALAVSHDLYQATGYCLQRLVTALRPLQDVTIKLGEHTITAAAKPTKSAHEILSSLGH